MLSVDKDVKSIYEKVLIKATPVFRMHFYAQ